MVVITAAAGQRSIEHVGGSMQRVVIAAALGPLTERYDPYLYGSLAVLFSTMFLPPGAPSPMCC
jgi:hypothetical protein